MARSACLSGHDQIKHVNPIRGLRAADRFFCTVFAIMPYEPQATPDAGYARTKADPFVTQCQRIVPDAGTLFSATRV